MLAVARNGAGVAYPSGSIDLSGGGRRGAAGQAGKDVLAQGT